MYYLYKISLNKYPFYYIGVTNDMSTRKWQHHGSIFKIIKCLLDQIEIEFPHLYAHYKIAWTIHKLLRKSTSPEKDAQKHYSITVLRRCNSLEEIKALESKYIKKNDPNNLNIHKDSRYFNDMKEKPYVIRGNNKNELPCVVKIIYGNRYVIAKLKSQAAGLKRIEDAVNAFMRGGANKPEGLYYHLLNYIKRQPDHKFKVQTLLFSDNPYELLKREQIELDNGRGNPNFLNNQVESYIPMYNEEKKMYGGWIPQIAVLNYRNWMKSRKKAKKTAV